MPGRGQWRRPGARRHQGLAGFAKVLSETKPSETHIRTPVYTRV